MRISSVCAVFAVSCAVCAGAHADWEYTKWGMTPEQVAAASKGEVKVLPPDKRRKVEEAHMESGAEGTHAAGPLKVKVGFSFDTQTGGLICVSYGVDRGAENDALKDWMVKQYGPPQKTGGLPVIGLQQASWTKPDDIMLQISSNEPAFVLHCRTK
jgi:hypothetical protein